MMKIKTLSTEARENLGQKIIDTFADGLSELDNFGYMAEICLIVSTIVASTVADIYKEGPEINKVEETFNRFIEMTKNKFYVHLETIVDEQKNEQEATN